MRQASGKSWQRQARDRQESGCFKDSTFVLLSISLPPMTTQVSLVTSDKQVFIVDEAVAQRSALIKSMLEGMSFSCELPPTSCRACRYRSQ